MNAEYLEVCKSKAFLASKASKQTEQNSNMKVKLETGDKDGKGPLLGCSATSQALKAKGFEDGKPLGAMQLILNDDLGLHHSMLDKKKFDGGWKAAYRQYGQMTKYGHLILAGTIENFQEWAKSTPCREEVKDVEDGRLFAYIEHQEGDTNPGQGYIVSIQASAGTASATIEEGVGYIIHEDGDVYHGELLKGKKHGQGSYTFPSGAKYVGEWQDGQKHGQGSFNYASGGTYVGQWQDDKYHGRGVETFPSGNKYEGQYKDDKRNGEGFLTFSDGGSYIGQFENDTQHGQGCYTFAEGESWTGPFVHDEMHGVGIFTGEDGTTEEEEYVHDELKE